MSPLAAPPAEASEALDHVDAHPEPGHVEAGGVEKLGASPMKKRKQVILDLKTEKLVSLFRGVAASATRLGHAEVACGDEEALPVLLRDPQGHTTALAGNAIGALCSGQPIRPVGGTDHIVDRPSCREGHCRSHC